jgi:pyruvate,water dikinase
MGRLSTWLRSRRAPARDPAGASAGGRRLPFKLKYTCFRELLGANDHVLELIAGVEDGLAGQQAFGPGELRARVEAALLAAFVIVKNLNLISEGRYLTLYDALERVHRAVQAALGPRPAQGQGPLVVSLSEATRESVDELGGKMANLGEVRNRIGLAVPDGFVITTAAFDHLLSHDSLGERIAAHLALVDPQADDPMGTSAAIQATVLATDLPEDLAMAVDRATADLAARASAPLRLAVRSSAVGEDGGSSYAGQFQTVLNVAAADVLTAFRQVVASLYGPGALAYRRQLGFVDEATRMAVGCIEMVDAVAGGVMFTRDPARPDAPHVLVEAVPGQGATAANGTVPPDHFVLLQDEPPRVLQRILAEKPHMLLTAAEGGLCTVALPPERQRLACISDEHLHVLARIARVLEEHFGTPQDVEWALDRQGQLCVLQTRPLACAEPQTAPALPLVFVGDHEVLVRDGVTAAPGVGAGVVARVESDAELEDVPRGAVLVARHSSPAFVRVMRRVAAVVTEVGGRTGHMAIVAREFGVPTIVGAASAAGLRSGTEVTVDANRALVFAGRVETLLEPDEPPAASRGPTTPLVAALARVAPALCPLHLTDPEAGDFVPASCQSLHDVTRFAHERSFAEMFHIGDDVKRGDEANAVRLMARLPIEVYILDLGGALGPDAATRGSAAIADVTSAPLAAFVAGLMDPRIRWDQPRPVSVGGFLSVVGESLIGPPPSRHSLGRRSFALASDTYLNFSTRAGYHFSTLDTYCGNSINKNYLHFRFVGGAAAQDRRVRRAAFIAEVLRRQDFAVQVRGDVVSARLQKYPREIIARTLETMGRLTICARQLDMLMDSDAHVGCFVGAFLGDNYEPFSGR